VELLGPTALRERLASEFQLPLSSREVNLLMGKFDLDRRGSVDLADVFGNAILISKKKSPNGKMSRRDSSSLAAEDSESNIDTRSARSKASLAPAAVLEEKLAVVAADALRGGSRNSSLMRMTSTRISNIEFRHILKELDCGVTKREEKMLERKYKHVPTGNISLTTFLDDFKKLGRKRQQYLDSIEGKGEEMTSMQSRITATEGTSSLGGPDRIEFQHAVRVSRNSKAVVVDTPTMMSPCATVDSEDPLVDDEEREESIQEELEQAPGGDNDGADAGSSNQVDERCNSCSIMTL
jgi:hypothetical protein